MSSILEVKYIEKNCIRNLRDYYKVSHERWKNANSLYSAGDYLASIYLAGYSVECILKYVLLETLDATLHQTEKTFSIGKLIKKEGCYEVLKTHNLKGLIQLGNEKNVFKVPKESDFKELVKWTSEWRYSISDNTNDNNAKVFLQSVELLSQQLVTEFEGKIKLKEFKLVV